MENALLIGLSRQMAMTRDMATIANNIANVNTTAYKAETMMFEQFMKTDASELSPDKRITFVQDVGQYRNMRDGALQTTGNPFDIAITGEGYFRVDTQDGVRFTRNGNFNLNNEGQLVTSAGDLVLTDAGAPIAFANDETGITIARDGTISTDQGLRGRLAVVTFENPQALKKTGDSLFETDQQEIPAEDIRLVQGALEGSNVNPILEMTNMIEVSRAYASAQKIIDQADQMRRQAIQQLGGSAA
ncbi:MAG: flagellar basal-body rod protein FlgF [Alphaproteobacteria bacterium]|nr:flagellar basal-body rod protein FlgF [Alphaproteobacteria bacterium]MDX5417163.1 flagellar basal-body rod protein FlgF [Alphaproteobacteria bacterium]MDX5494597.1 flagellar basal-body rod protein FlgF [Alphaproteobacteria bacterium]